MTISAKVIAASRRPDRGSKPLTTMVLRYPRFIHSEFMTHRVFSRNASSSRAVPVKKMIQDVIDDPAMPVRWGANQPGMQDAGDHDALVILGAGADYTPVQAWLTARDEAVEIAKAFAEAGYHKQVVNRLLEPFAHITVIVTATEWSNFFALRCHEAADPTMRALADAMKIAYDASDLKRQTLGRREWHLPYIVEGDIYKAAQIAGPLDVERTLRLVSAARCARVSYLNHDGSEPDMAKDLKLANELLASKHMSPFEHQGRPDIELEKIERWGNFKGWVQSRMEFEAER